MQRVALAQGWDPSAKRKLLDRAVAFEPNYSYCYQTYATSLLPEWDGEKGEVEDFLQQTADKIGGDEGNILYFRVAGYLVCCQTNEDMKFSWPRIQGGFNALEHRSGVAMENLNYAARLAANCDNPVATEKLLARIGDQWTDEVWQTRRYFDSIKDWATHVAPMDRDQAAKEDAAEANMQTPAGQRYRAAVDEKMNSLIPPCVKESGSVPGKFEILLKIEKEGLAYAVASVGANPVGFCLIQKANDPRPDHPTPFPPPPHSGYWVRFDLESESSVASR
jgi:hypothetical protein